MNKKINLVAEDCVRVEDFIYFIAQNFNIICKIDIHTGKIDIVGSLPNENLLARRLGAKTIHYGDRLVFLPMNSKKIWCLDIKNNSWQGYGIKDIDGFVGSYSMLDAVLYKDKVFIISCHYPAIVVMDMLKEDLEYIYGPYTDRRNAFNEINDGYFRAGYVQKGNKLYIASCLKNEVLCLDMETYDYEYLNVGKEGYRYSGIDYDGEFFYLSPRRNNPVIRWNGKDEEMEINVGLNGKENSLSFAGVVCKDNEIIFPSLINNHSVIMEKCGEDYKVQTKKESYWFYKKVDNDTYVSLSRESILTIKTNEKEYQYKLCADYLDIAGKLGGEMKSRPNKEKWLSKENRNTYIEKYDMELGMFVYSL